MEQLDVLLSVLGTYLVCVCSPALASKAGPGPQLCTCAGPGAYAAGAHGHWPLALSTLGTAGCRFVDVATEPAPARLLIGLQFGAGGSKTPLPRPCFAFAGTGGVGAGMLLVVILMRAVAGRQVLVEGRRPCGREDWLSVFLYQYLPTLVR